MNPKPGDLVFTFHPGNLISEAIAYVSHCQISHVQCIVDIGIQGTLQVITAEAKGLIDRWVMQEDYPWQCILTCPGLTLRQRDDICKWMWDHQGLDYDVWGLASFLINIDLNNEDKVFCSEACFLGYQEAAGIEIIEGVDHAFVSPRDLYMSPILKTLDGSRKEVR